VRKQLVVAGVLVVLTVWTAMCVRGISEELAADYDGFFTDFSIAFYALLIALPWLGAGIAYWVVRSRQGAR
jgi:hypothetical protein